MNQTFKAAALVSLSAVVAGCDLDNLGTLFSKNEATYSIWPSAFQTTPQEFGEVLKRNPNAADEICASDANRPKGFTQHIAAMANHEWNRVDLIDKYNLDKESPVLLGDTGRVLAQNLGLVMAQSGGVNSKDEVVATETTGDVIRFTFSENGMFTGYCEETKKFTPIYRADRATGEMKIYSMSCSTRGGLVCLSIKK